MAADEEGIYRVPRRDIARRHAMSVGTIVSDAAMHVAWMTGGRLGTIEEGFIARLKTGDCFSFAGRVLELVKVRDMTAYVRKANRKKATVPQWRVARLTAGDPERSVGRGPRVTVASTARPRILGSC